MNDTAFFHEQGFAHFVDQNRRERIETLLSSPKTRKKLIASLSHFSEFEEQRVVPIDSSSQNADQICELLCRRGAPPTCYVMSENPKLDRQTLDLHVAIEAIVGFGYGAFVSCEPSKLAFYEGESFGRRFILALT